MNTVPHTPPSQSLTPQAKTHTVSTKAYATSSMETPVSSSINARIQCLKWATPEEELQGIAEAVHLLTPSKTSEQIKIGIMAPTYTWATQMQQACKVQGIDATVCLAIPAEAPLIQRVVATLKLLEDPTCTEAQDTLKHFGIQSEAQAALIERWGHAQGLTLVRGVGLDTLGPLEHALRHLAGDEDARRLRKLLEHQTSTPTMQGLLGVVPIMDYSTLQGTYDWLFLLGCVEGLLPEASYQVSGGSSPNPELNSQLSPLARAVTSAHTAVISHFAKIDEGVAQSCGMSYVRTKQEGGRKIAMTRRSSGITAALPSRPTTEGGQTFLNNLRAEMTA